MRFGLRAHLAALFMLIALAPILLFGVQRIEWIGAAHEEAKAGQYRMTLRLVEEIAAYVASHRQVAEAFAGEISQSGHRRPEELTRVLQAMVENFPGFLNVYAADANGRNRAFYTADQTAEAPPAGYDFSSRIYYDAVAARRETVVSPVFVGEVTTRRPLVIIAAPVFDAAGGFDGYVSAALDLGAVEVLARKYGEERSIYAAVIDADGRLICSTAAWADGAAARDLTDVAAVSRMRAAGAGAETLESALDGAAEYLTYTTVPELGWTVYLARPSAAYRADFIWFLRDALGMIFLTLGGCAALSWYMAGRLNRPIRLFVQYMRDVGAARFAADFPQRLLRRLPCELYLLAERFFAMARRLDEERAALRRLTAELEDQVARRTDNLQAVLESMSDAVVMVDEAGRVALANGRAAGLLGFAAARPTALDEAGLRAALSALSPGQAAEIAAVFAGESVGCVLAPEGGKRRLAMQTFAVESKRRARRLGRGFLFRDITERYAVEQLKNNLISLAAHEFKTPLTGVRGGVETLLRRDVVWDEAFRRALLGDVLDDVLRIQRLVEDWLDISKLDAGTMRLHRRRFALREWLEEILRRMRRQGLAFASTLSVEPPELALCADPERLEQVVRNIVENAVFYSEASAAVDIAARLGDGRCVLRFADRGVGIAAADLPHVFERFFRADLSSTRRRGGTGLGLAVCQGIVAMHGGRIAAESAPGKGSVFTIELPMEKEAKS